MTHTKKVEVFCKSHAVSREIRRWLIEQAKAWDEEDRKAAIQLLVTAANQLANQLFSANPDQLPRKAATGSSQVNNGWRQATTFELTYRNNRLAKGCVCYGDVAQISVFRVLQQKCYYLCKPTGL